MINKSFFSYSALRLNYSKLDESQPEPVRISIPEKVSLLFGCTPAQAALVGKKKTLLKKGVEVKTGERLRLLEEDDLYVLSSVTGTVLDVGLYTGPLGRKLIRINITPAEEEVLDPLLFEPEILDRETSHKFISQLPGRLRLIPFTGALPVIKELVVCGEEKDLSVISNRYAVKHDGDQITAGIELLKHLSGAGKVTIAVQESQKSLVQGMCDGVYTVPERYPAGSPRIIARQILGRDVPAGTPLTREGLAFVSSETAASLGRICRKEEGIFDKSLSVVLRNGDTVFVKVRIGTPISHILAHFNESVEEGDYLIAGGPLTGVAVYDPDYSVSPYMDAIVVSPAEEVLESSDYSCINCGKCVRVCPASIPVNMLVRHLTASNYQQAQDDFNLDSCLECGLCTYICVSKIPIMQRIKLGKMKLRAMKQEVIDGGDA